MPTQNAAPSQRPSQRARTAFRGPPLQMLVYAHRRRLTATVVLECSAGLRHMVYFLDGAPARVATGAPIAHLDSALLQMGVIEPEELAKAVRVACEQDDVLLGELLITRQLIDLPTLEAALRWQLQEKLGYLISLPEGLQYELWPGENLLLARGGHFLAPVDPLAAIMAAARAPSSRCVVEANVKRLEGCCLYLQDGPELQRFAFNSEEWRVLEVWRGGYTMAQLAEEARVSIDGVQSLIYGLSVSHLLTRDSAPGAIQRETPPRGYHAPITVPDDAIPSAARVVTHTPHDGIAAVNHSISEPPVYSDVVARPPADAYQPEQAWPEHSAAVAEPPEASPAAHDIDVELDDNDDEDDDTMRGSLPVPMTMPSQEESFDQDSVITPPTPIKALTCPPPASFTDSLRKMFTGSSEPPAAKPSRRPPPPGAALRNGFAGWDADSAFTAAEVALKGGRLERAEAAAAHAASLDPDDPSALTLLAWVRASRLGRPAPGCDAHYAGPISELTAVIRWAPNHEPAYYFRGRLLKRTTAYKRAMEDFEMAVILNPQNRRASLELRHYEELKHRQRKQSAKVAKRRSSAGWLKR